MTPDDGGERPVRASWWRQAVALPLTAGLLAYEALDALLGPLVRPALRALAATRIVHRLEAGISALPPYGVLGLLVVPFVLIEPVKLFALYWMATGGPLRGAALLAAAHLVSIVTSERILHVGLPKLLTIPWFARVHGLVTAFRDRALGSIRASAAWRACVTLAARAKTLAARVVRAVRF